MTRTVADSELLYQVMAGRDDMDATSSSQEVNSEVAENTFEGKKGALLSDAVNREGIDAEVKERLLSTADALRAQGAEVSDEEFGLIDYMVPTYYVLSTAEASSNLSRFDGVHYGYRADDAEGVENVYTKSRSEGFGPEVQRRIMTGTFVLSAGYYDAYYSKWQKVRRLVQKRTEELLEKYDAILLPTTPSTAFGIGADKDPISMYLEDIFTVQANLAGIPAISVPVGRHSNGLPFGVQLMTAKFAEDKLFGLSKEIEKLKG